jgi:hypothetical protein
VLRFSGTPSTLTVASAGGTFSLPASPVINRVYEPVPGFYVQYRGEGYVEYSGGSALAARQQTSGTIPGLSGQTLLLSPTYKTPVKECMKQPCPQDLAACIDDLLAELVLAIAIVAAALAALVAPPPLDAAAIAAFMALVAEFIEEELDTERDCGFLD